jgi:hypothetical protein
MTTARLAAALLMFGPAIAQAQVRWGQEATPNTGVCFYQDANFRGQYFCVRRGQGVSAVPSGMNNRISSIRVFGNANVTVFRDVRFRGASARFEGDIRNLRSEGWNDNISSLRVGTASWIPGRPPSWGKPQLPRQGACFYRDANFRGEYFCVNRGGSYATLPSGFNDRISSIRVRGANVMLFRDRNFDGRSQRVSSDVVDMRRTWNDTISSLRVF